MGFLDRRAAVGVVFCVFSALARADADPASLPFPGSPAGPPEVARWRAAFSPLTIHFSSDSDHKPVVLFGFEREHPDGILWGGAAFTNSFGQPSGYAFGGQRIYRWSPWEPMYAEWTAGLLYGYRGEYKHKVPFNYNGFSPGLTVGIGWRYSPTVAAQVNLLGTAGLMFMLTYELP
jgi:hypothetical protein